MIENGVGMEIEIIYSEDETIICNYCGVYISSDMDDETCICDSCWKEYYTELI